MEVFRKERHRQTLCSSRFHMQRAKESLRTYMHDMHAYILRPGDGIEPLPSERPTDLKSAPGTSHGSPGQQATRAITIINQSNQRTPAEKGKKKNGQNGGESSSRWGHSRLLLSSVPFQNRCLNEESATKPVGCHHIDQLPYALEYIYHNNHGPFNLGSSTS